MDFLLRELSGAEILAGARLTGMPYPNARSESRSVAHLDGVLSSTSANSIRHRRILSLVYLLGGHLDKAGQELGQLGLETPDDAGIQNDLGVVQMGLAASEPSAWITALRHFEAALAVRPNFPEAKFNLILSYRRLGLRRLEARAIGEYQKIEPNLMWYSLEKNTPKAGDAMNSPLEQIDTGLFDETFDIVGNYPADARQVVLDFAFHPILPIPSNYQHIAQELSDRYGDDTAKSALSAISTHDIDQIVHIRNLATAGRQSFLKGRLEEGRRAYKEARNIAIRINSLFDQLWIEINDADCLVQLLNHWQAAEAYRHAAEIARQHHLQWLLARALSSLGSEPALSGGIANTVDRLNEAVQVYRTIGETRESARPLYYLAGYHWLAASFDESLRFSLQSLNAADPADHLRLSQVHSLISKLLARRGDSEIAARFYEEAVDHAEKSGYPRLSASMKVQLASVYMTTNRMRDAAAQLEQAKQALPYLSPSTRALTELSVNLTHARLGILSGNYAGAEAELRRNIVFLLKNSDIDGTQTQSESRMFLAEALSRQGRKKEAAGELREAINLVETRQDRLSQDALQITFDQHRREVYEAAIALEYDQTGCEEPWNLTQRYKAKLFLNSLQRFGAAAPPVAPHAERLNLSQVQRLIPGSVQIVDYIVLSNQLLVWVISQNNFQCRSVAVNANELQEKIDLFLSQVRQRQPSERSSRDLYDILVEPIEKALDSTRIVVVIPDGNLYRLPFSAIAERKDGRYWIEMAPIIESPSVTYLLSGNNILSTGSAHIAFGSRRYDAFVNAELNSLEETEPAIHVEAGQAVTKEGFLKALRDNSLFYYAGHSAFDIRNALQSSILLDGDKVGPNAVSALDVMRQPIKKNALIILSSCETSVGNSTDGAGIGGLTSAFLLGGAGSVVGSIWPVESSSTMQLMSRLFKSLVRDHRPVAESLQAAQIALMHNPSYQHPYYWSGFAVTGNWSAIGR